MENVEAEGTGLVLLLSLLPVKGGDANLKRDELLYCSLNLLISFIELVELECFFVDCGLNACRAVKDLAEKF